ncbi:MAG TPA: 7-carboxy-7-deazaguanine synthase QueE [Campylobacterales bacterium]|nr:7-carboxy-7-deazaguanine synthase QueE [Campylobacterales bacterium]
MIPLVESFYSFQGEGKFVGSPSVFIRLGGCNLGCAGFGVKLGGLVGCDSIKAVNQEHFGDTWEKVDNLIPTINEYIKELEFKPDIVFTGGEPLLHYQNPILLEALSHFQEHRITFETNATIEIDFEKYPNYKNITFAMSVKLENSGEAKLKRINHQAINAIVKNTKESFFKFVLSKKDVETKEIEAITKPYQSTKIYCMPMGSTAKELAENDKAVANFCIKKGYNYVDRMHIRLWDNEEGR